MEYSIDGIRVYEIIFELNYNGSNYVNAVAYLDLMPEVYMVSYLSVGKYNPDFFKYQDLFHRIVTSIKFHNE